MMPDQMLETWIDFSALESVKLEAIYVNR